MKLKTTLAAAAAILTVFAATAQKPVATLKIWDNATAPHSNGIVPVPGEDDPARTTARRNRTLYLPGRHGRATGQAVVICPGGSYLGLAIGHEGHDVARWLSQNGVTAAVLKYRMPNGHPEVPLEDVQQALRIMAGLEAGATGFSADKVGVMGFSAGGHLAATASTIGAFKPAFSILFYPVITAEPGKGHQLSFDSPAGNGPHGRTVGILLAPKPRDGGHAPDPAAPFGRRHGRTRGQQRALLRSAQSPRREGFDAHLPDGRARLGLPHELPLPRSLESRRAGVAAGGQPITRGAHAPLSFFRDAHCRLPIISVVTTLL